MKRADDHNSQVIENQRYLSAEFGRLKQRLRGDADDNAARAPVEECRAALSAPAPIDVLANLFGLSPFERDVLLLCAGVEMDAELGRLCAEAQGGLHRPPATF
ncbi:MAG TPA: ATP-binding protein, partial [Candidatus Binatia bacterium]